MTSAPQGQGATSSPKTKAPRSYSTYKNASGSNTPTYYGIDKRTGLAVGSDNDNKPRKGGGYEAITTASVATPPAPAVNSPMTDPEKPITNQLAQIQGGVQAPGAIPPTSPLGTPPTDTPPTPPGASTATPGAPLDMASQYKAGASILNQSGSQASATGGGGYAAVNKALATVQQPPEAQSVLAPVQMENNPFADGLKAYDDYMSPVKQKQSLLQEYKSMSKALGIEDINEELIDAKRIIEGTEDDIRAEVTAAGGFGTDSQVQALANARNKSLIKNYNVLLETRDNAMQQLTTMMNLSMQDRQLASQEFDRKINFGWQQAQFVQRAQENARTTYLALGDKMGWDTLINSASPYQKGIMQKTLGLSDTALNSLMLRSQEDRIFQSKEQDLKIRGLESSLQTDALQRVNIQDSIRSRREGDALAAQKYKDDKVTNGKTVDGKPQNATQLTANGYADRTLESNKIIGSKGNKFTTNNSFGGLLPNVFQSPERQSYEQAKRNFINAVLRRESGAAISPDEFKNAEKQYFPQAGDKDTTISQKAGNRNTVINNLYREANIQRPASPGDIIESGGKSYKVGADGKTLTEI